jgi:hypothetical protein
MRDNTKIYEKYDQISVKRQWGNMGYLMDSLSILLMESGLHAQRPVSAGGNSRRLWRGSLATGKEGSNVTMVISTEGRNSVAEGGASIFRQKKPL